MKATLIETLVIFAGLAALVLALAGFISTPPPLDPAVKLELQRAWLARHQCAIDQLYVEPTHRPVYRCSDASMYFLEDAPADAS